MIGIGILLHTQVTQETPCLVTVRMSIGEDVLKIQFALLTLTVQTRNHSKFIATTNTLSSREEWMDQKNFNRGRADYVSGFERICGEHWLGLEKFHCLTTRTARTEMRMDMADFQRSKKYSYYNFFMDGNAASKYKLQVAGYNGTAGDCISSGHSINGMAFSTHDNDNDLASGNCAATYKGGWCYDTCMHSQLIGIYQHDTTPRGTEVVHWYTFTGNTRALKFAEMKIRVRD